MPFARVAAPDSLVRLETFCNSARFLYGEDAFGDVAGAGKWLRAHEMPVRGLDECGLARLTEAREAIRDHLGGETGATLNRYTAEVLTGPVWAPDGRAVLEPKVGTGVDGLLGELLAELCTAALRDETARLKVCRAPECRWVFYDRSPAGNSVWCSMEICGARHKMRAYRARR
ncbi:CGNR zinc finger domain-containing protein [Amycolatopsis sp.]|uniref:CGNR zinc finger domain-containing protein n=1 Tax=Amycolatopsis sp. TaxID=37632 RepID=UPI002B95F56C|nr:CGNR zinc finger domain-containing protein [Amycolatopsis sp.]HVV09789.1 CGNR zinc finger domain-containing protein [Amycolatopsis sp.]